MEIKTRACLCVIRKVINKKPRGKNFQALIRSAQNLILKKPKTLIYIQPRLQLQIQTPVSLKP